MHVSEVSQPLTGVNVSALLAGSGDLRKPRSGMNILLGPVVLLVSTDDTKDTTSWKIR